MDLKGMINRERVLATFFELLSINSPSYGEAAIYRAISARLKALGFKVRRQKYEGAFNLIAKKKGTVGGPPILLSAHMDTVEPTNNLSYGNFDGVIKSIGGTILGADDKCGIAEILEALAALIDNALPHPDIEVVFTSVEERGLVGAWNLDFSLIKSRHALVLDSHGHVGKIVLRAPTHYTYNMTVTGTAAHAGIEPEKGISSIRAAAMIISALDDGRIDDETTANIGVISGGTATNVVPRETILKGEVRSHCDVKLAQVKSGIFASARQTALKCGVQLRIDEKLEYSGFKIDRDDPFTKLLAEVFSTCGMEVEYTATGGGSDANVFNAYGITTLNLSCGMQQPHTTEEHIHVEDLVLGGAVVLGTITGVSALNG
jgi:tripeptide aminopeptidase